MHTEDGRVIFPIGYYTIKESAVDTDGNGTIDEDEIYELGDVILTFYTDAETGEYTSPSDF